MAQVVKPNPSDLGYRPELDVVLGAAPQACIISLLLVPASRLATAVLVALHKAGMLERSPQHFLQRGVPAQHGSALVGKHQGALGAAHGLGEIGDHLLRQRDDIGVPTLGGFTLVGPGDHQLALLKIDVALSQSQNLALPQPCVHRHRKQRAPLVRNRLQNRTHLMLPQEVGQRFGTPALGHALRWIRSRVATRFGGGIENAAQVTPQMVDAAG
ncbi:MAG TPA: hypothetical protein VFH51_14585 [Myxococcota bacterium]|nr:hypothetical protein [Myxococcota bacterium]